MVEHEDVGGALVDAVDRHRGGAVILMELPVESYMSSKAAAIRALTSKGYGGVFISVQRPYKNVQAMLTHYGVDTGGIVFIDAASSLAGGQCEESGECFHVSREDDVDELVRAIIGALGRVKSQRKFIYMDSLTTIALHKPLSEVLRLTEFLRHSVGRHDADILVLNVPGDLAQREFIRDIALKADEVVRVGA
jgi:hypothetical protein